MQSKTGYLTRSDRMRSRTLSSSARQHEGRSRRTELEIPQPLCHSDDNDDEENSLHSHDSDRDPHPPRRRPLSLRQRLRHFTWAWYTVTMSTGGLSVLLFNQPHQFPGLRQIGMAVYATNIILFLTITSLLVARFLLHPGSLKASLLHRRESFFVATALLSIATLLTSTERYVVARADPHAAVVAAVQWSFWAYVAVAVTAAVAQYASVFSRHRLRLDRAMPTWILPIFPVMLAGTIASVVADTQPDVAAVPMIVAGLTCQGLGLAVAGMMYALLVGRLFSAGLPDREHRPGLFMCVGPPAFTALALVGMGNGLPDEFDADFDGVVDARTLRTLAVVCAVFLWALSFWWFGVAAVAVAARTPRYFHLGWWAAVFPNSGFTLATIALGRAMRCGPILGVATGMSVGVVLAYMFVLGHTVRAVWVQDIMYPGRDEDFDDA